MRVDLVKRSGGYLAPLGESAEQMIGAIGNGEILSATIPRPQHSGLHRLMMLMLHFAYDHRSDEYKHLTFDAFRGAVVARAGHSDPVLVGDGMVLVPRSISYAALSRDERSALVDKLPEVIVDSFVSNYENESTFLAALSEYGHEKGVRVPE